MLSQVGRAIYKEFLTVVVLKQQIRVTDVLWLNFLHCLCYGEITDLDLTLLCSLVLTLSNSSIPDFAKEPWKDVMLVMSQHAVWQQWNDAFIHQLSKATGQPILISPLQYKIKGSVLTLVEHQAILQHTLKKKELKHK